MKFWAEIPKAHSFISGKVQLGESRLRKRHCTIKTFFSQSKHFFFTIKTSLSDRSIYYLVFTSRLKLVFIQFFEQLSIRVQKSTKSAKKPALNYVVMMLM